MFPFSSLALFTWRHSGRQEEPILQTRRLRLRQGKDGAHSPASEQGWGLNQEP